MKASGQSDPVSHPALASSLPARNPPVGLAVAPRCEVVQYYGKHDVVIKCSRPPPHKRRAAAGVRHAHVDNGIAGGALLRGEALPLECRDEDGGALERPRVHSTRRATVTAFLLDPDQPPPFPVRRGRELLPAEEGALWEEVVGPEGPVRPDAHAAASAPAHEEEPVRPERHAAADGRPEVGALRIGLGRLVLGGRDPIDRSIGVAKWLADQSIDTP